MRFIFVIISLYSFSSFASEGKETDHRKFCEELVQRNHKKVNHTNSTKMGYGFILKALFSPQSFVDLRQINKVEADELENIEYRNGGNIAAFINLEKQEFTNTQQSILNVLKEEETSFKDSFESFELKRKLKNAKNAYACMNTIDSFIKEYDFSFDQYEDLLKKKKSLIDLKKKKITYELAMKKLSFLKHKKIKTYINKSYAEIFSILNKGNISVVFFIGHSNEYGDLYFGYKGKERLPSNFFDILKYLPGNLIFFSCNGKAVIKKYGLDKLNSTIHFSFVSKSEQSFFGNKVPFMALKGLKNILRRKTKNSRISKKSYQCYFSTKINSHVQKQYVIRINNDFIYATAKDQKELLAPFPCSYLNRKQNKVKINSLDGSSLNNALAPHDAILFDGTVENMNLNWQELSLEDNHILQVDAKI